MVIDIDASTMPFVVPVAAFAAWVVVAGLKTNARYKVRQLQSQERLLAIEKGQPLPPEPVFEEEREPKNTPNVPSRRISYLRTGGIVCLTTGIGVFLFFAMLAHVLDVRPMLCGSAAGLIPIAIGAGLLIDVRIQSRSLQENAAKEQAAAPAATSVQQPPAGYLE